MCAKNLLQVCRLKVLCGRLDPSLTECLSLLLYCLAKLNMLDNNCNTIEKYFHHFIIYLGNNGQELLILNDYLLLKSSSNEKMMLLCCIHLLLIMVN